VEIREGDDDTGELVGVLNHEPTVLATTAERALLRTLEGGCQIPVGALGRIMTANDGHQELQLDGVVGSLDGTTVVRSRISGLAEHAERLGEELAEMLLRKGADRILQEIRSLSPRHFSV
jgi:hydroxymethylbilane synthase